jgi:hypothetical protein
MVFCQKKIDFAERRNAFTCKIKQQKVIKTFKSDKISGSIYLATECNIPEDLNDLIIRVSFKYPFSSQNPIYQRHKEL